jgi:hypothetical protein
MAIARHRLLVLAFNAQRKGRPVDRLAADFIANPICIVNGDECNICHLGRSGKYMLVLRFTGIDPTETWDGSDFCSAKSIVRSFAVA